jgi:hypothetical protein
MVWMVTEEVGRWPRSKVWMVVAEAAHRIPREPAPAVANQELW